MLWSQQDPMGKAGVWLGQVSFIFLWPYASPHGLQETKGPEVLAFAPHTVIWVAQQPAKFLHLLELFPNLHH